MQAGLKRFVTGVGSDYGYVTLFILLRRMFNSGIFYTESGVTVCVFGRQRNVLGLINTQNIWSLS